MGFFSFFFFSLSLSHYFYIRFLSFFYSFFLFSLFFLSFSLSPSISLFHSIYIYMDDKHEAIFPSAPMYLFTNTPTNMFTHLNQLLNEPSPHLENDAPLPAIVSKKGPAAPKVVEQEFYDSVDVLASVKSSLVSPKNESAKGSVAAVIRQHESAQYEEPEEIRLNTSSSTYDSVDTSALERRQGHYPAVAPALPPPRRPNLSLSPATSSSSLTSSATVLPSLPPPRRAGPAFIIGVPTSKGSADTNNCEDDQASGPYDTLDTSLLDQLRLGSKNNVQLTAEDELCDYDDVETSLLEAMSTRVELSLGAGVGRGSFHSSLGSGKEGSGKSKSSSGRSSAVCDEQGCDIIAPASKSLYDAIDTSALELIHRKSNEDTPPAPVPPPRRSTISSTPAKSPKTVNPIKSNTSESVYEEPVVLKRNTGSDFDDAGIDGTSKRGSGAPISLSEFASGRPHVSSNPKQVAIPGKTLGHAEKFQPLDPSLWWWKRGPLDMSKDQAEALLCLTAVNGDFLVRLGQGGKYFVLSRMWGNSVRHARIVAVDKGFRFDGEYCTVFSSVEKLIGHFQTVALADGCILLSQPPPRAKVLFDVQRNLSTTA